jgi:hypothetical protein
MYVFKTESTIRKKDIVSKYFVLKNMKHQYVKIHILMLTFVLIENNTKKTNYLNKIEKDFKERIKNKIERNEKTKDITYNERFKINE